MSGYCFKDNTPLSADGICPKCGTYYPKLDGLRSPKEKQKFIAENKVSVGVKNNV